MNAPISGGIGGMSIAQSEQGISAGKSARYISTTPPTASNASIGDESGLAAM
jgi:hypothetical protein